MKAEYINPFIKATLGVLKKMAFIKAKAQKPYLKKTDVSVGDVSAVVGLTGETQGSFTISFDAGSIKKIASNLFGEEMAELDSEVADVAGEIANMISGQARREIEGIGVIFHGSVPTIFTGENHVIRTITTGPKIGIPFNIAEGDFAIELNFEL